MPKSDPSLICNFCNQNLRQHETFMCYACVHELCPQLRDIANRKMTLKTPLKTKKLNIWTNQIDAC